MSVLFDPLIGPYQVLPLQARVDLGVMAMKDTLHFPKLQHYWSLSNRWFNTIYRTTPLKKQKKKKKKKQQQKNSPADMQLVYPKAPINLASKGRVHCKGIRCYKVFVCSFFFLKDKKIKNCVLPLCCIFSLLSS